MALESSPPLPSLYVASCPVDKDSEVFQDVVPSEAEALSRHKVFEHHVFVHFDLQMCFAPQSQVGWYLLDIRLQLSSRDGFQPGSREKGKVKQHAAQ